MKKLNVLFLSLVALGTTIASCSKDDNDAKAVVAGIEGKWTYDTYTYTDAEGTTAPELAYQADCPQRKYFDFRSAGELEFGIANPANQAQNPCKFYKYIGAWSLNKDTISTTVEGDTKKLTLISVSSTNLVFRYPQTGEAYYKYTLKKS